MHKKTIATGIFAATAAATMIFALTGCGQSGSSTESSASSNDNQNVISTTIDKVNNTLDEETSVSSNASVETISPDDLAKVDIRISFGDYASMEQLSKSIQNGEVDGQVVEVKGLVSNFANGTSYNIVQHDPSTENKVGTTFVIEGVDESAYPLDGTRVTITGVVKADPSGLIHSIHTLPEFVLVDA